jgi:hypothetical protein
MSTTYLVQTGQSTVAADGTATVTFRPDVGQYWAPSMVRVSTRVGPTVAPTFTPNVNASYCALFHGASAPGSIDATAFLDDTYKGAGDTSSVISGTVVLYGEVIVAKWANAVPGVTVVAIVYGRSSNDLTELQGQLSPIPGAKFSGNTANALLWDYDGFSLAGPGSFTGSPPVSPSFVTPSNAVLELVSVNATVVAGGAGGPRTPGCQAFTTGLSGPAVELFRITHPTGQAASNTITWCFAPGVTNAVVNALGTVPIPPGVVLPPGSTVQLVCGGAVAGDTWSNWSVVYRQFNTLGKVTFT